MIFCLVKRLMIISITVCMFYNEFCFKSGHCYVCTPYSFETVHSSIWDFVGAITFLTALVYPENRIHKRECNLHRDGINISFRVKWITKLKNACCHRSTRLPSYDRLGCLETAAVLNTVDSKLSKHLIA